MAQAARATPDERDDSVRARVHGAASARSQGRVLVRDPELARNAPKPELRVVPRHRRRAGIALAGLLVMFGLMLGAAAFQMQVARRQVQLDRIDRQLRTAKSQYDLLRRQRAELRSPGVLVAYADQLKMEPATKTRFISLRPAEIATMQQMAVPSDGTDATGLDAELATYTAVKAQAGGAP